MNSVKHHFRITLGVLILNSVVFYFVVKFLIGSIQDSSLSPLAIDLSVIGILLLTLGVILFFIYKARNAAIDLVNTQKALKSKKEELEKNNFELNNLLQVVSHLDLAVAIVGKDDKVEWINSSFTRIFGFEKEEVVGSVVSSFLAGPQTDHKKIKEIDEAVFERKQPIELKILHYRKDRSSFWARLSITPIVDESGALERYIAVSADITPEVEASNLLAKSEANFRQITETVDECFYLYDIANKKYDYISPNSLKVMGAEPDFFYQGLSHTETFVHEEDKPLLRVSNVKVDNGEPYSIEYRVVVDNEVRWIREQSFPIRNELGKVTKNSGVCRDITEQKKLRLELDRNNKGNELLAEIGLSISEDLSVISIIRKVYSRINGLMDAPSFGIGICDETNNRILFPIAVERDREFENVEFLANENSLAIYCARNDKEVIIQDLEQDAHKYSIDQVEAVVGENAKSLIYLPLRFKGKVIGVITVQSFESSAYNDYHIQLLRSLSVYVATALANANIYEDIESQFEEKTLQLEKSYSDISQLSEIGIEMVASRDIDAVFDSLYQHVNKLLDATVFGIRVLSSDQNFVEYKYEIENGKRDESLLISMEEQNNLTVWCIRNNQDLLIKNLLLEYSDYVSEIDTVSGEMPDSLIMCPIVIDGQVKGAMTVQSYKKNAYDQRHLDIVRTIVAYVAAALKNFEFYSNLDRLVELRTSELAEKSYEVTSSINYARRIQEATLPTRQEYQKLLPNSFVLYRPKDIVSGDFYRIDKIRNNDGTELVGFVIGDCTGHGVPGATLAILCSSLIKQSLSEYSVNSPGEALDFVRDRISNLFKAKEEDNFYDGMDVAFGVIDPKTNMLYYAGAFRDLFIVRNGELEIIKGDRQHVGYNENHGDFITHSFQLEKGDCVYTTTDGYVDQFGGDNGRKFMMRRFLDLMFTSANLKINDQEVLFNKALDDWQGNYDQIDDICLLGFKVE